MLGRLAIPQEIVEWVSGQLSREKVDERATREAQTTLLRREEARLLKRLETLYLDKLSGDVSLDAYRSMKDKAEADLSQIRGELATAGIDEETLRTDPSALLELAS